MTNTHATQPQTRKHKSPTTSQEPQTHEHGCTHKRTHKDTHTQAQTQVKTQAHTQRHTYRHRDTHRDTHGHTHATTDPQPQTHTHHHHKHAHTSTPQNAQAHTHAHTQPHTHLTPDNPHTRIHNTTYTHAHLQTLTNTYQHSQTLRKSEGRGTGSQGALFRHGHVREAVGRSARLPLTLSSPPCPTKKNYKSKRQRQSIAVKRVARDVTNVSRTKIQTHRQWRVNHQFLADLIISSIRTDPTDITMREGKQNPVRTSFLYTSISKGCPHKMIAALF